MAPVFGRSKEICKKFILLFFTLFLKEFEGLEASPVGNERQSNYNCGGSIFLANNHIQSLSSPYFPNAYPNGARCLYLAYSPPNTAINLNCKQFNIAPSQNCALDAFYFSPSGDRTLQNAHFYCGNGQLEVTTNGNSFAAGFFTNTVFANRYSGFSCVLKVVDISSNTETHVPNPETTKLPEPVTDPPITDDCACGVKGGSRIVGGQETEINEWPWQAGLRFISNGEIFCGATLISDRWLVTASHCVEQFDKKDFYVSLGDHDKYGTSETTFEQHITVDTVIMHESYDANTVDNDIAVIRLSSPVTFNEGIRPICLPFKYADKNFSGTQATVTGWGQLEFNGDTSQVLQEVKLPVLTTTECEQYPLLKNLLTDNMICTYKKGFDACKGDSGGPLQWEKNGRQYLIGIVSFGKGCADEGAPGVYTKVVNYLQWIEQKTSANLCSPA